MQGILGKPLQMDSLRQVLATAEQASEALAPAARSADGVLDQELLDTHRSLLGEQKLQGLFKVLASTLDQQRPLLDDALAAADSTQVQHLAHRLAGSADSLGFCELARVLRALEDAAGQSGVAAMAAQLPHLRQAWQRARRALEHLLAA